jgi:enterochelin esterase-like enzyme
MPYLRNTLGALMLQLLLLGGVATAAAAQQQPSPVVSPEVHEDRRVTLRVRAPLASEVEVTGEILDGNPTARMTKGEDGVWTLTLGPLQPDVYTYAFRIDGVNTPDPVNPYLKPSTGPGLATQVQVPGDEPQYYDMQPVPQGMVHIVNYHSSALGVPRAAWVYTPPGYQQGDDTYPVLYLLHGGGDTENGWVLNGRANIILDNLIAEGRARPMVVVMPRGHVWPAIGVGPQVTPIEGSTFEQDLLQELMPLVERSFRVSTAPAERGIMGLSMGGGLALRTGLAHLDRFDWVIGLAAAVGTGGTDPAQQFATALANPAAVNQGLRLLYLTVGDADFLLEPNQRFADALTRAGIEHTFRITEGAHTWRVWRRDLYEIAPLLFR